jgi:hypothetical protein
MPNWINRSLREFVFIDAQGVRHTAARPEHIRVYSLPGWRAMLARAGLAMTQALADTKLPLVPYDRDHFGDLVIVGRRKRSTARAVLNR